MLNWKDIWTITTNMEGYGYVYNPDAFYDWYCIGGRWPKLFLIKEDCTDFTVGDRDYPDEYYKAPDGYKWAAAARKKDIQWKEELYRKTNISKLPIIL